MELISKILFGIANSLLIPDMILLIIMFLWALIMLGLFYGQFITRKANAKRMQAIIDDFSQEKRSELLASLPEKNNAPHIPYMREILTKGDNEDYAEYCISNFEIYVSKDLNKSKLMCKIGPILGLVGTLIAMSPALVGLSTGDIGAMAYNMQVVFATTVLGLVVSAVGLITLLYKQRWYQKDVNNLLYIARVLQGNKGV